MTTNSNGNTERAVAICVPTSYCDCVPVPVSPMIAKRTEPCSRGLSRPVVGAGVGGDDDAVRPHRTACASAGAAEQPA
jgi:hypothetical protein